MYGDVRSETSMSSTSRRVGEPMLSSSRLRLHRADGSTAAPHYRAAPVYNHARHLSADAAYHHAGMSSLGHEDDIDGAHAVLEDGTLGLRMENFELQASVTGMCSPVSQDEADDEYDCVREVASDVEDEAELVPDMLSERGEEDIPDLISDEQRELLEEAYLAEGMLGSSEHECAHSNSAPLPSLHRELRHLGLHGGDADYLWQHDARLDLDRGEPSGEDFGDVDDQAFDARCADDEIDYFTYRKRLEEKNVMPPGPRAKGKESAAATSEDTMFSAGMLPGLDLFGASFFAPGVFSEGKQPDEKTRRVLMDKDWVSTMLSGLPGVDPEDPRIQCVLSTLRGKGGGLPAV